MKKSIKVAPKKRRGRPATGKDPHIAARMPPALIAEVKAWAAANDTTRSDAFRRLVELGLTVKTKDRPKGEHPRQRAREIAGNAIDKMTDAAANPNDQASRKQQLIKGPDEFREVRVDRPRRKP
jgi:hypothetical protein